MSAALTEQEKSTYCFGEAVVDVTSPPSTWEFSLGDVWTVLSNLPRYLGGSKRTVAEHSEAVSRMASDFAFQSATDAGCPSEEAEVIASFARLRGLWHDASEAFTGDIPGPMKKFLNPRLRDFEGCIQEIVYEKAGVSTESVLCSVGSLGLNIVVDAVSKADAEDYRKEQAQAGHELRTCPDCRCKINKDLTRCWPCYNQWKALGFPDTYEATWVTKKAEPVMTEGHCSEPLPPDALSSTPKTAERIPYVNLDGGYSTDDLLAHHDALTGDAFDLMLRKNNDYAGESGTSPFKNFLHAETLGLCTTEQGMVVRLSDKLQRLAHFVSGQEMKVSDEGMRDTILDIINYAVLISAYTESKKV